MEKETFQILAGSVAGLIFMSGTMTMVIKAWQTRDMDSYSRSSLILNNVGNLLNWIYILSLPFGPIYFLHMFYTITTLFMLGWYQLYRSRPDVAARISQTIQRVTQSMPQVNVSESIRRTLEIPTADLWRK